MPQRSSRSRRASDLTRPAAPAPARHRDSYLFALLLVLLLAAGLRLYAVMGANYWLDELWTLELSCGRDTAHEHLAANVLLPPPPGPTALAGARPWWAVWTTLGDVTHPPLFFLLLRVWREVFGPGEMATRLLPLAASLAGIVLLYRVARDLHGPGPAVWACLLMAVAGQPIYYAQEVRGYSLTVALGLGACGALVAVEKRGPTVRRLAALAAWVLAMVLTHYFAVGGALALAAYAALRLRGAARVRVGLAFAAAGGVFLLAWGPWMWAQRGAFGVEAGGAAFLADPSARPIRDTLWRLTVVPAHAFSPGGTGGAELLPLPLLVTVCFLAPLPFLRRRPDLLLWYLWAAGTVGVPLALDLGRHTLHLGFTRYTLLAVPAVYAALAAAVPRLARPGWAARLAPHGLPAAGVAACIALLPASLAAARAKPDWQPLAAAVAESAGPGEPIVFTADEPAARWMYLYVAHYAAPLNHPVVLLTQSPGDALLRDLRAGGRTWVVYGWDEPPAKRFPSATLRPVAALGKDIIFGEMTWPPTK